MEGEASVLQLLRGVPLEGAEIGFGATHRTYPILHQCSTMSGCLMWWVQYFVTAGGGVGGKSAWHKQ